MFLRLVYEQRLSVQAEVKCIVGKLSVFGLPLPPSVWNQPVSQLDASLVYLLGFPEAVFVYPRHALMLPGACTCTCLWVASGRLWTEDI